MLLYRLGHSNLVAFNLSITVLNCREQKVWNDFCNIREWSNETLTIALSLDAYEVLGIQNVIDLPDTLLLSDITEIQLEPRAKDLLKPFLYPLIPK